MEEQARQLAKNPEWTFVGGFRSGSTLLINLLGLHPEVSVWYETKGLCEPLRWMKIISGTTTLEFETAVAAPAEGPRGFSADAVAERMRLDMQQTLARIEGQLHHGKAAHEQYPLGADHIDYALQDGLNCVEAWRRSVGKHSLDFLPEATATLIRNLGDLHLQRHRGCRLINKTPEMPRFGAELRACLGPCRVLNLIRDGREVAASAAALNWGDVYRMGEFWAKLIFQSRAAAEPDRANYLEVRYEDLVAHPVKAVDQIFEFLQLRPFGDQVVRSYERQTGVRIAPSSRACGSVSRVSMQQLPPAAVRLLGELGYT